MAAATLTQIAILGAGFAGAMTAAALTALLPEGLSLTLIDTSGADKTDLFYGTVTSPATYNFLLAMGIREPDVLPHTNTAFSLGTHYESWGLEKRSWTQAFHQPLPLFENVHFQHYMTRLAQSYPQLASLQPYIMSVHAARRGVFAHPPESSDTPLSDVEYGYQFLPQQWRNLFLQKVKNSRTRYIQADIVNVKRKNGGIDALELSGGETFTADFFIDCTGQNSNLTSEAKPRSPSRRLSAIETLTPAQTLGPACRKLSGQASGWVAQTPLQDGVHELTIGQSSESDGGVEAITGRLETPWSSNVLTLGHGAALLEPLTPAPIITLQRDIERLAELIPLTSNMDVEAREYNRRFNNDYHHAAIFQRAFFSAEEKAPQTPYWIDASRDAVSDTLQNKISQFESRGICVQYDLEPFVELDWLQLHYGMGRQPARYDPLADRLNEKQLIQTLQNMRLANEALAAKMPPHQRYMSGLLNYLRKKNV